MEFYRSMDVSMSFFEMLAGLGGILFSVLSILPVTISFPMSMATEAGVSVSDFQRL